MPVARKLPSGSWRCQVYSHTEKVWDDTKQTWKSKRIYESFTSDDTSAHGKKESELAAAQFSVSKEHMSRPSRYTLSEAIESYLKVKEPVLSKSTIAGYKKIKKYAFSDIMPMRLRDIDTTILMSAVSLESCRKTAKRGCTAIISPKTVKNEFGLITAVLNYYGVSYNERKITLPQIAEKKIDLPAASEIFSAVYGTDIELPVLLAMWLSFSASEIAGLSKSTSILGDGEHIAIHDVILTIDGKEYKKSTGKRPKRQRVLKLPEYIKGLIDKVDGDRIVQMQENTIYRKLKRYLKKANVKQITFHQLRHVNASVMHSLNVPDKYAQDRGGWSSNYIMHKNYTHTFTRERQIVDDAIDAYFNDIMQHEMQHETEN